MRISSSCSLVESVKLTQKIGQEPFTQAHDVFSHLLLYFKRIEVYKHFCLVSPRCLLCSQIQIVKMISGGTSILAGRRGGLDLASTLEAKFRIRSPNKRKNLGSSGTTTGKNSDIIRGKRIFIICLVVTFCFQYYHTDFGFISEIQRAKFRVIVTSNFGSKIWGSDTNFRGKFWGQFTFTMSNYNYRPLSGRDTQLNNHYTLYMNSWKDH